MKTVNCKIISVILVLSILLCLVGCGEKTSSDPYENAALQAVAYLCDDKDMQYGAEWEAVTFAAWENIAPKKNWQKSYIDSVSEKAKECNGVFDTRKLTEQATVVIGVTAAGYDAASFEGYDLTLPLADYETALLQGINGAAWALIALEFGNYEMPQNPNVSVQATKDMYIDYILSRQLEDGGFAFSVTAAKSDPDMTGMVLLALANYIDRENVSQAVERCVECLSGLQDADGGYSSYGNATAESCAQVILALMKLGISLDDERFVKNGKTVMDKLLEYKTEDGAFSHMQGEEANGVATEQAMMAIVSYMRVKNGNTDIFSLNK